jgi:hypothetical protein
LNGYRLGLKAGIAKQNGIKPRCIGGVADHVRSSIFNRAGQKRHAPRENGERVKQAAGIGRGSRGRREIPISRSRPSNFDRPLAKRTIEG